LERCEHWELLSDKDDADINNGEIEGTKMILKI